MKIRTVLIILALAFALNEYIDFIDHVESTMKSATERVTNRVHRF